VRLHKLEFSALLNSVRGLHRKRRELESRIAELEARFRTIEECDVSHEVIQDLTERIIELEGEQ
jgi:hypothetical protein